MALAFTQLHQVNLILLDMNLTDGDGLEFYQQLNQQHRYPPVTVMLTADVSEALKQRCLSAGIAGVLHKPLTLHSLRQCMSDLKTADVSPRILRQHANAATFMQIAQYLPAATVKDKVDNLHHEFNDAVALLQRAKEDTAECQKQLHRLASLSASLGLEVLADHCRALEQQQPVTAIHLDLMSVLAQRGVVQLKTKVQ